MQNVGMPLISFLVLRGRMLRFLRSLLLFFAVSPASTFAVEPVHVAAAADLQFVLPELVTAFAKSGGEKMHLSFGSSGNFARQIAQGAPFALFLSADAIYAQQVVAAGLADGKPIPYASGRLALFLPSGSRIAIDRELADFAAALQDGRITRLALANPEHAPYGRAAREVLENRGLWAVAQPKLALGDNAAQAAQFAATGAAQAGLIPLSLARAPELARHGSFATLPATWHAPLVQTLVVIKGSPPVARRFAEFLRSKAAQDILRSNGFAPAPPPP